MVLTEDLQIAERDPDVPGFSVLLDATRLGALLAEHGLDLPPLQAKYVRYKPHTNALVGYGFGDSVDEVRLYAKAYRHSDRLKLDGLPGLMKSKPLVLSDHAVAIYTFPCDARIPAMARMRSRASDRPLLERLHPDRNDLWDATVHVLRYKPERRFVGRLEVDAEPRGVLKLYATHEFSRIRHAADTFRSTDAWFMPRVLGRSTRYKAISFSWVQGKELNSCLSENRISADELARAGHALRGLHQSKPLRTLQDTSKVWEIKQLRELLRHVSHLLPSLDDRLKTLMRRVARVSSRLHQVSTPVHGDFYAGQVILSADGRVALIDFDRCGWGDPLQDLGNMLAHLERDRRRGILSDGLVDTARTHLVQGYGDVDMSDLAFYESLSLIRLLLHPFRFRDADWPSKTEELVETAEVRLSTGERNTRRRPLIAPLRRSCDEVNEHEVLEHALDINWSTGAFSRMRTLNGHSATISVDRATLVRHKPGRRALVAYEIRLKNSLIPEVWLGKVRFKGLDRRTPALSCTLRELGFIHHGALGVEIPEPIGVVPELNMWLQRQLPGDPLGQRLEDCTIAESCAAALRAVMVLHHRGPIPERRHPVEAELAVLRHRLGALCEKRPEYRKRIAPLLERTGNIERALKHRILRPAHRDFYPDNVIVNEDAVSLLDLDLYALADPALDAGNFLAHLTEWSLRIHGHPAYLEEAERASLEAFEEVMGEEGRLAAMVYQWLTLLRHVDISDRMPDRRHATERILSHCERQAGTTDLLLQRLSERTR